MGQRHQAFVIARVVPHGSPTGSAQYRCIGALHHQWCYGVSPPRAATRFMTLIKQEDNAATIREEVRAIDGLYGQPSPPIPDRPCPFTSFLLWSAWSTDLSDPKSVYQSGYVCSLEAGAGSRDAGIWNDDGITIIDVADPKNPSYCFYANACSKSTARPPMSAADYVGHYYKVEGESVDERILSTLRPYESVPLITFQTLAEAWPDEYVKVVAPAKEVAGDGDQPQMVPLLADLVLKPAVEHALFSGSIDELEFIMAISDKRSKIKEILRSRQDPIPDSGIPLLSKLLELETYDQHEKTLDISQFPLSDHQILDIVAQHADLGVLNISHNKQVTIDVVEKLLVALPKLRRLLVLNTSITEEDAIALLEQRPELFRNLEGFIHPAFLTDKARFKGAYIHISNHRNGLYAVSVPFFTTGQIIQGLTDYLNPLALDSLSRLSDMTQYENSVMAAYASQVRRPGQSWEERVASFVPATLPPAQSLARKGRQWLFVLLPVVGGTAGHRYYNLIYAFARVSGEVWDEYLKMMEQIDGETENSGPTAPMSSQEKAERVSELHKGLGPRLFEIFDMQQFFKELELEGREPPSPEALSQLFDIFSNLDTRKDYGPQLIDVDQLVMLFTKPPQSWMSPLIWEHMQLDLEEWIRNPAVRLADATTSA